MNEKKVRGATKRKWLTLEQKLEIIKYVEAGMSFAQIARNKGLNESSIRSLLKRKEQIRNYAITTSPYYTNRVFKSRSASMEIMECLLMKWINDCTQKNRPLNLAAIQTKAKSLFKKCRKESEKNESFSASHGWFYNFKRRMGLNAFLNIGNKENETTAQGDSGDEERSSEKSDAHKQDPLALDGERHEEMIDADLEKAKNNETAAKITHTQKKQKVDASEVPQMDIVSEARSALQFARSLVGHCDESREDAFGRFVASELKQIKDAAIYIEIKWKIQEVLTRGLLKQEEQNSKRPEAMARVDLNSSFPPPGDPIPQHPIGV